LARERLLHASIAEEEDPERGRVVEPVRFLV
jgi:hypothetical protein